MKKMVGMLLSSALCFTSIAQISISSTDMPVINTPYRYSASLPRPDIDFTKTGTNYTWDYSSLVNAKQYVDTFVSVSSIGTIFNLLFVTLSPGKSSYGVAFPGQSFLGSVSQMPANVRTFQFFANNNTAYSMTGLGVISDTISIPLKYSTPDVIYKFPLTYGLKDTSSSGVTFPPAGITGFSFSFDMKQKRTNEVDGWGKLKTPYGSFDVLRVKSHVTQTATMTDSTGTKNIAIPSRYEYTWLAKNIGTPLLSVIVTNDSAGQPVAALIYRDSLRAASINYQMINRKVNGLAINSHNNNGFMVSIPEGDQAMFSIIDVSGKCIETKMITAGASVVTIGSGLTSGTYIGMVTTKGKTVSSLLHYR